MRRTYFVGVRVVYHRGCDFPSFGFALFARVKSPLSSIFMKTSRAEVERISQSGAASARQTLVGDATTDEREAHAALRVERCEVGPLALFD